MLANLNTAVIYHIILTLENVGTAVNYSLYFYSTGPRCKCYKTSFFDTDEEAK